MTVTISSIQGLFQTNTVLRIPFFQRPYVWNKENWDLFLSDMIDLLDTEDNYQMGAVLLKEAGKNDLGYHVLDVVDGQQRLTTMVIFSKILYAMAGRSDQFNQNFLQEDTIKCILEPSRVDTEDFVEIVFQDTPADAKGTGQIANAYNYMRKKMKEIGFPEVANTIYRKFKNQVEFIKIVLSESDNEQFMFERLNASGRPLSTGDKLKNHLLTRENRDLYDQMWAPVFESGADDFWGVLPLKGRKKQDTNIESFFFYLLQLLLNDRNLYGSSSTEEKRRGRKQDHLFENYVKLIKKHGIEKSEFIALITKFAWIYKDCFKTNVLDKAVAKVPSINRLNMLMQAEGFWAPVPYILYVKANVSNPDEQDKIFSYLESYLVRRIICKSSNNSYNDLFSQYLIGNQIATLAQLKAFLTNPERGDIQMPSDAEVTAALSVNDLAGEAKTLLYLLESKQNATFTTSDFDNAFSQLQAEAVMPKKPCAAWPIPAGVEEADYLCITHTLGNYTLIRDGKLSAKTSAKPWAEKRGVLKERCAGLEMGRVCNSPEWTVDMIASRNAGLAELICKHWAA